MVITWLIGLGNGLGCMLLWSHIGYGAWVMMFCFQFAWLGLIFTSIATVTMIVLYAYDFYTCPNMYDKAAGKPAGFFMIGKGPGEVNKL